MRQLFLVLISLSLLNIYSCDDGDIITVELDFEETFEACEGVTGLIFYKTKDDPSESLSLKITGLTLDDILEVDEETKIYEEDIDISATNPFNYRTYSNTTISDKLLFCNDVPLSDVTITQDIESTSGTAKIKTTLTEDDDDGVPAELEDINGNGDLEDDDTDEDGIPDYLDVDDDGDNVLTKDENPDPNNDGDISDAQNSDFDHELATNSEVIPDYLDKDDDGDGVPTRDEENKTQDQIPTNDKSSTCMVDGKEEDCPDYLNPAVSTSVPATKYREGIHTVLQTYTVTLTISNFDLTLISLDVFDFGILEDSKLTTTATRTPEFKPY
ncbi:hypothetical protein [Flavivirga jejuensis]|uniref:Thrombospondin type 3 repeat-containing protein n=1 Tax=Flavivirga jejuensis TaxID=870487 RepID=A0ABT8WL77_9FLAO|nr:hypothetical protein [Flavivirga jejuensis]MDO5973904.1 hypothetical protein [Flavivirga jejuensis]